MGLEHLGSSWATRSTRSSRPTSPSSRDSSSRARTADPTPVRGIEHTPDEVVGPSGHHRRDGGADAPGPGGAAQVEVGHEPTDPATADLDALPVELAPDVADAVDGQLSACTRSISGLMAASATALADGGRERAA